MAAEDLDLAGLVRTVVEPLLDSPEALEVTQRDDGPGEILVEITVDEDDAGKVIGRQGRVIKAIRTLARAAAMRTGDHVEVEIVE